MSSQSIKRYINKLRKNHSFPNILGGIRDISEKQKRIEPDMCIICKRKPAIGETVEGFSVCEDCCYQKEIDGIVHYYIKGLNTSEPTRIIKDDD